MAKLINWAASLSGLIGLVVIFFDGPARAFMLGNPLLAWVGLGIVLIASPLVFDVARRIESRKLETQGVKYQRGLSDHWQAEERRMKDELQREIDKARSDEAVARSDIQLVEERIRGFELNSDLYRILSRGIVHTSMPIALFDALYEKLGEWQKDPREVGSANLNLAFGECSLALESYMDRVQAEMWENESSSGLHVAPEWKHEDPERYREAMSSLASLSWQFFGTLQKLHRIIHRMKAERNLIL